MTPLTSSTLGEPATHAVGAATAGIDPAAAREQLRLRLRAARLGHGLTQQEVATALEWSLSKLVRLEAGHSTTSKADLSRLLTFYLVDDTEHAELVRLSHTTRKGSWRQYRDIFNRPTMVYLGLEATAAAVHSYQPSFIPDLLQAPDYARHLINTLADPDTPEATRRRQADAQLSRQQLLCDADRRAHFVIAEEVILRAVYGVDPAIIRDQLSALADAAVLPGITIQILPLTAGITAVGTTPFTLLSTAEGTDSLLCLDGRPPGIVRADEPGRIRRHRDLYTTLARQALSPDQSLTLINTLTDAVQRLSGWPMVPTSWDQHPACHSAATRSSPVESQ